MSGSRLGGILMIFNVGSGGASSADKVKYDNSTSGLEATNVQGAIDEVNNSFGGMKFGVDENGNYGYIKAGADTVIPFSNNILMIYDCGKENSDLGIFNNIFTQNVTAKITKTSDGIVFENVGNYWQGINLNQVIDLSEYYNLYFEVEVGTLGRIQMGIANTSDLSNWNDYNNARTGYVISSNESSSLKLNNISVIANSKNTFLMTMKNSISNGSIVLSQSNGNMTVKKVYAIK